VRILPLALAPPIEGPSLGRFRSVGVTIPFCMSEPATATQDRHFRTDHLEAELKQRTVRGGAVTMSSQAIKLVLRLGQAIVLARLLPPEAFGLIAMVTALTGFVTMFKDAGLSTATVQRQEVNHQQVSTLFWVNVALGAGLMILIAAASPLIAWIYHDPRLTPIAVAISSSLFVTGLGVQHQALLRRQMRFGKWETANLTALALAVGASVTAASLGAGYWALVLLLIVEAVTRTAMVWILCDWRPDWPRRRTGVRPMLAFGGHLSGGSFVGHLNRKADDFLLGWVWGASALGLYTKAYSLLLLPAQMVQQPFENVVVPVLSRLQNEPARYRAYYKQALSASALLTMPMAGLAFATADVAIPALLGPGWEGAIPIFRIFSIAAFVHALNGAAGWVNIASGRTDLRLKWAIIQTPVNLAAFIAGLPWGALGIATAYTTSQLLLRIPGLMFCLRGMPVELRDVWDAAWLPAVVTLIATGGAWVLPGLLDGSLPNSDLAGFLVRTLCFAVVFAMLVGVVRLVFRPPYLMLGSLSRTLWFG